MSLFGISSCTQPPTNIILNLEFDTRGLQFPPALAPGDEADTRAYLFIRLMQSDGTVIWSNEQNPRIITNLVDDAHYQMVLAPSTLNDPSNRYILDAHFYDEDYTLGSSINPTTGGDAERFTQPAVNSGSTPAYDAAPHVVQFTMNSGEQKTFHLRMLQEAP